MSIKIWSPVMLLVLCMLGQIQGLPIPAPSSVPQPESASSTAWKECDAKSKKAAYDGRSLSSLQYDAEPPLRAMPWWGDRIGEVRPRFVYDAYPIANIRATGPARAPPVDEAELTAAKTAPELTGQIHHGISRQVHKAHDQHPNLQGVYQARDPRFVTQAKDAASHTGYQQWHRRLDTEVSRWIESNPKATPQQFENYMRGRYSQPDLVERFPNGL